MGRRYHWSVHVCSTKSTTQTRGGGTTHQKLEVKHTLTRARSRAHTHARTHTRANTQGQIHAYTHTKTHRCLHHSHTPTPLTCLPTHTHIQMHTDILTHTHSYTHAHSNAHAHRNRHTHTLSHTHSIAPLNCQHSMYSLFFQAKSYQFFFTGFIGLYFACNKSCT